MVTQAKPTFHLFLIMHTYGSDNTPRPLTLKCFVRAVAPVLVRMREQAQLPVRFLDTRLADRGAFSLYSEYVIEGRGLAAPHARDRGFLVRREGAAAGTVVVCVRPGGGAVGCLGHGERECL